MLDSAANPATAFVDLGYRGVDAQNLDVRIVHRGKTGRISEQERKKLKRRQAIEPIIGPPQGRSPQGPQPPQGRAGRPAARGAVCDVPTHPMAAAHDGKERGPSCALHFCADIKPAQGSFTGWRLSWRCSAVRQSRGYQHDRSQTSIAGEKTMCRSALEMNISGPTH